MLFLATLLAIPALAAEREFTIVIQDHGFQPAELVVPVGERIKLVIENRDPTPEEFESHALNREKVIPGKSSATIWVGPLAPGRYSFYGEFNEKTAQGAIVAK
jgi:heme/copper-type cytochrome/quinol oxidase subunit 2